MNNYGTYTTVDVPIKKQYEAFKYLSDNFRKIKSYVRAYQNRHDMGTYPSFEIDYPDYLSDIDEDDDDYINSYDRFHDNAEIIIANYRKKFSQYL